MVFDLKVCYKTGNSFGSFDEEWEEMGYSDRFETVIDYEIVEETT